MKRTLLLVSAVLLSVIAGVQTAMAQKVTLYSAGSKAYECDVTQLDSIVFNEGQSIPAEEIVVTIDANGNADGEHWFEKIDETNFYIDDIKYTAQNGDLVVTGYNKAFFKGAANIISQLKYRGRTMNVVEIRDGAFRDCEVLTSVTIPNSVASIGRQAFYNCSSLTSITIPESVTSIGNYAFSGCNNLEKVIVPDIAAWCNISFSSSYEHYYGEIDESTESIVDSSNPLFYSHHLYSDEKTEITKLIIPEGVTSIGNSAFRGCSSLTSVTISNNVTSIGGFAFRDCSSLTSVSIGNSVTGIGDVAFAYCSNLTSITIPNSVTSIGNMAFYGCSSLTSITIPNIVTSIGSSTFEGCSSLTSVTIPNSVTGIGKEAFYNCSSLTSITIPNSVSSIGSYAFPGCSSLTSIIVENGNTVYDSRNNCNAIIETATNTLIAGCKNTTIPSSVTSIGEGAFVGCSSLTSITIPESVTSIGGSAFWGCISLTSIAIPNSVTSIRNSAFQNCSSLTSVTIPGSVTSIEGHAFNYCSSLTDVYCHAENVPVTSSFAFNVYESNTPISSATLHVPAGSVNAYKAKSPWNQFGNIVAIE